MLRFFGLSSDSDRFSKSRKELLLKKLDYVETIPVRFDDEQDLLFEIWAEQAVQAIRDGLDDDGVIEQRFVALKYRLEKENGGVSPVEVSEENIKRLKQWAQEWKLTQPLLAGTPLSPLETIHLKNASRYPLFVDLIARFPLVKNRFMDWVIRDENDVAPFIQFPAAVERLLQCGLSGRISRFGGGQLKIMREPLPELKTEQKILTLPFEGKDQSILDPSLPVTFKGGYRVMIQQVFDAFADKTVEVGNLEFMREGIVNWNIHHLAIYNPEAKELEVLDIEKDNWWKQMPLFELLTRRQVFKRYNITLKPRQWVAAACATRGRPNLDYEETHAFLEVAIPHGKGMYAVYDFGKLALEYPKTLMDKLAMFTKNVHATVAYPDENVYYSHRQKGFEPFALTPKQGKALMEILKNDITLSRRHNFIYQIESENCAKWVHETLEGVIGSKKMPDLFRMQLLDTEPQGPVALLFSWIKQLPAKWQVPVLAHLHLPLGAFRKIWIIEEGRKVAKSLSTHTFFETGQIYLPALLVAKVMSILPVVQLIRWVMKRWEGTHSVGRQSYVRLMRLFTSFTVWWSKKIARVILLFSYGCNESNCKRISLSFKHVREHKRMCLA